MGKKTGKKRGKSQPWKKVRLSLCMIARDEAGFLDQCLRSVQGLVDEIVLVDTGSVDETVSVARKHGARVFSYPWNGDFSAARNQGLARARGEWILVLDCDEVIAPCDHEKIRQAMAQSEIEAFRLTTRNYLDQANRLGWVACDGSYAEEKGYRGWFPTTKVRLWRRRPEVRFEGVVHELVEPSLLRAGRRIGDCLAPVHHYGYAEKTRDPDHYLRAGEEKVRAHPEDLRAWYELAIAYRNLGRLAEALQSCDRVIAGWDKAEREAKLYLEEELVLLLRADILVRLGQLEPALEAYDQILTRFPRSYQALNNKGLVLERLGRREKARNCYEQGLRIAPENPILADNLARLNPGSGGPGRLSVCLIARNEEEVLGRCLESVRSVADEIVVVDTGSTDRTAELAEKMGARVGYFAWNDDFAAARNASLDLATGDWILWLDADDYLLPVDQQKVQRLKTLAPNQAFYFTLVNEGGDRSTFRQVKMFPHRPEIRFERPVHETVAPALGRLEIPIRVTDVEVRHTGYADSATVQRKQQYYLALMERWLAQHPEDHYIRFRIGHTWYAQGALVKAREWFACLLKEKEAPASARRLAATFVGRSLLEEGEWAAAIPYLEQALQWQPDDALALLSLGDAHLKLGQCEQAIACLQAALQGRIDPFFPLDGRAIGYSIRFFLGQAFRALGRDREAVDAFQSAREWLPERPEAAQALEQLRGQEGVGPPRLSLCMIVRDEEARLGRCLESVQGLVDEIVVVDTGSIDRTIEVARRFGARIGYFAWNDDFAAARNASLSLATGDWILWLDADDLLPAEAHSKIRHLLGQGKDKSYFFVLDDRGYEHVSCLQLRLFPNLPGVAFEMPVHEQVTPSLARLGVQMVPTDIRVIHTGYATPEVVRAKKERYLKIMERWLEEHPENYIVRSHVALIYHSTGRLDEAIQAYRRILFDSSCWQDRNYVVYTTSLLFLGRTYLKKGELDQALEFMRQAETLDPDYQLTQLSLAEVQVRRKEFAEALRCAQAVLARGPQLTFFPVDQQEVTYAAHLLCGQALGGLGDLKGAEQAFRQAAAVPVRRRSEALGSLSELFRAQGQWKEALEVLREAHALDPGHLQHLFNLGAIYLEQKELDQAAGYFRQVVDQDPDFAPALLNLGYIAKVQGRLEEAEQFYRRAVEGDASGVEARANLGHLYLDQERFAEAEAQFLEVWTRKKGLLDVELGLLVALAWRGNWKEVRPLLEGIAERFPGVVEDPADLETPASAARVLVRLGALLLKRHLSRCAEFALAGAVFLDGDFREARRGLAEIYLARGAVWKAIAQCEALITRDPQDGAAFRRLGDCYQRLGVEAAAQLCYERSRQTSEASTSGTESQSFSSI